MCQPDRHRANETAMITRMKLLSNTLAHSFFHDIGRSNGNRCLIRS